MSKSQKHSFTRPNFNHVNPNQILFVNANQKEEVLCSQYQFQVALKKFLKGNQLLSYFKLHPISNSRYLNSLYSYIPNANDPKLFQYSKSNNHTLYLHKINPIL